MPTTHPESGGATVELAVALPVLVLAVATACWALGLAATRLRLAEAARAGARAAARGDPDAAVTRLAVRLGDVRPADVRVARSGDTVTVRVASAVPAPGLLRRAVRRWVVVAEVTAAAEPPVDPAGGWP